MAYRSLTLAAFACIALAGPALAGSSMECHGGWYGSGHGWGPKRYIYECQATAQSRYGTTQTTCNSRFGCVTTSERKRQPRPAEPPPAAAPSKPEEPVMFDAAAWQRAHDRAAENQKKGSTGIVVCGSDHWVKDHWEPSCK